MKREIYNREGDRGGEEIGRIRIGNFDYPLPEEYIAKHPLAQRDACRLLKADRGGKIAHHIFSELPGLIPSGSLMIANETRVINARLKFRRESGASIEVFILEPSDPADYAVAFAQRERCEWICMIGNLKRWKEPTLRKEVSVKGIEKPVILTARLLPLREGETASASRRVEFSWDNRDVSFAEIVEAAGNIPIPPYLKRESEATDLQDYQTVYSRVDGSVAAPTAGLHFTPELFAKLEELGIEQAKVTLHVGAGTFQPVKSEEIGEHPMHTETIVVDRKLIAELIRSMEEGRNIVAIGTTSVRTIESLPLFGQLISEGKDVSEPGEMHVGQWDAYREATTERDTIEMLRTLHDAMISKGMEYFSGSTAIMIAPGFKWRIVDMMVTNFHQPQSTLLLLVSSFLGLSAEEANRENADGDGAPLWRRIYDEALREHYRFLSYGDACLFSRRED